MANATIKLIRLNIHPPISNLLLHPKKTLPVGGKNEKSKTIRNLT